MSKTSEGRPAANKNTRRDSVLADRIAAGLADPISDEERRMAAGMAEFYRKKFGKDAPGSKTGLTGVR